MWNVYRAAIEKLH